MLLLFEWVFGYWECLKSMHEYIYKTYFWNKTQTHSTVWHILLYNYKTRHSDVRPQLLTANSHLTVYDNDMNTLKSSFWKTHSVISYFVFWPNNCTCSTTFSMHANGCICNWLYSRALGFGVCLQLVSGEMVMVEYRGGSWIWLAAGLILTTE